MLLFALSWAAQRHLEAIARARVQGALETILQSTAQALDRWLDDHARALSLVARDPRLIELIEALREVEPTRIALRTAPAQARIRALVGPMARVQEALGFLIIGPNGIDLAADRDSLVGARSPLERQPEFLARVRQGHVGISHPQRAGIPLPNAYGVPTLFAAAPVHDRRGATIAVLALRLDPEQDFSHILQRGRLGASGETYASDAQGRLMSHSRFDR